MQILLTSFKRFHDNLPSNWLGLSIAVYQPHWLTFLPRLSQFDIRNEQGNWIRPKNFIEPDHDATKPSQDILDRYRDALCSLYDTRYNELPYWENHAGIALCCWCPYDKAANRQLKDYGSFICHSAAVEYWIKTRTEYQVVRDNDRKDMVRL